MRSGNCTTKSKRPYLQNPRRHQLDEEKLGDPMTMFGKNDAPFQGGKKEKGPSWTGGEGQAYTDVRASMRLLGRCWYSRVLPAHAKSPGSPGDLFCANRRANPSLSRLQHPFTPEPPAFVLA